jgi:hypothetical protein
VPLSESVKEKKIMRNLYLSSLWELLLLLLASISEGFGGNNFNRGNLRSFSYGSFTSNEEKRHQVTIISLFKEEFFFFFLILGLFSQPQFCPIAFCAFDLLQST